MKNKERVEIFLEVTKRIKAEVKDFNKLLSGTKEQIQDKYINIVCLEKKYTLSEFYTTDGKYLEKLFNMS